MNILAQSRIILIILLLGGGILMMQFSKIHINSLKKQHKEEYKEHMRAWNKMYLFGILCVASGIVCLILLIIYH